MGRAAVGRLSEFWRAANVATTSQWGGEYVRQQFDGFRATLRRGRSARPTCGTCAGSTFAGDRLVARLTADRRIKAMQRGVHSAFTKRCTIGLPPTPEGKNMIDQIRRQIQERLDEVNREAAKLRGALAALNGRSAARRERPAPARDRTVRRRARSTAATPAAPASSRTAPGRTRRTAGNDGRAASGTTKAAVLEALGGGEAMTAGSVAEKTGLGRASVSTTLSKLSKSGEIQKADRGYRLRRR
jgi:DNA-binding transcriptional ArsR family regulator